MNNSLSPKCESMHSRISHTVTDWFIRGGTLFDMKEDGSIVYRKYGRTSCWQPMPAASEKLRYRSPSHPVYFNRRSTLVCDFKHGFLEMVTVASYHQKRPSFQASTPMVTNKISPYQHADSFFCDKEMDKNLNVETLCCNNIKLTFGDMQKSHSCFGQIIHHLKQIAGFSHLQMVTIQESYDSSRLSSLPPSQEKETFDRGMAILPLTEEFWTVIDVKDRGDDEEKFRKWTKELCDEERKQVEEYLDLFPQQEGLSFYHCCPSALLAFHAEQLTYGMLFPPTLGVRRTCIFTQLNTFQPSKTGNYISTK